MLFQEAFSAVWNNRLYESWGIYENLNICDRWFQKNMMSNFLGSITWNQQSYIFKFLYITQLSDNECFTIKRCTFLIPELLTLITIKIQKQNSADQAASRVPGLPIRDCAGSCNSSAHKRTTMSAIDVTVKTFFERVYLIPGLSPFEHRVKCPCAPTPPPYAQQLFLDFCEFCFPEWPLNFFCHHDSPSNLAESRYPRYRDYPWKTCPQGKAFSSLLQRALAHAHSL